MVMHQVADPVDIIGQGFCSKNANIKTASEKNGRLEHTANEKTFKWISRQCQPCKLTGEEKCGRKRVRRFSPV